ncbi:MAG: DUF6445 family protein [Gammaproteobacteria bacterium]|nr:DUF6445 family protein [Gammaproteobacteria bacterium]MDH3372735.1 DUF6445 family protein [Gammaproteobacteria bacterium]MDH3550999.1 DUF6445 family protein [Gammaproteobacteria bacterium]
MAQATIRQNPDASPRVILVGEEKTPVIIINDFATDTSELIRYAVNSASFALDTASYYPGVRAETPSGYLQEIVRVIVPLLGKVYSVPRGRKLRRNASYSLVATPPEELQIPQRIPHFDSNSKYFFAMTHYLNEGEFGGTGLFRHKPTGFENVSDNRLQEYFHAVEAFAAAHGDPPAEYIRESSDQYERYMSIDYQPNRLVAYPGSLLHSGLISPERDVNADPAAGRLTCNSFVHFQ